MKKSAFLAATAAAVLVLAGCTDSGPGPAASESTSGLIPVTVGVIPIADTAALYLGDAEGYFADEGLDLTVMTATGGASIVPAVVTGDYQFGFSNVLTLIVGADKGLDLRIVSAASATTGDTGRDFGAVVVPADSDVETVLDLEGKVVSTNSLGNINDVTVRGTVDAAGADSSTIEFVEVAFPDAIAAVENNQVDAAFVVEPFVTGALEAGHRVVTYAYADFDPGLDIAAYFTTQTFADSDPETVEKFHRAIQKSLEFAQANPDAVREIIGTYTQTAPEVLAEITLPTYPTELNTGALEKLAAAAEKYGVLSATPDWTALLP